MLSTVAWCQKHLKYQKNKKYNDNYEEHKSLIHNRSCYVPGILR